MINQNTPIYHFIVPLSKEKRHVLYTRLSEYRGMRGDTGIYQSAAQVREEINRRMYNFLAKSIFRGEELT